jgi:hypothetical protein
VMLPGLGGRLWAADGEYSWAHTWYRQLSVST